MEKIHELFGDSDYRRVLVVWAAKDFGQLNRVSQGKYGFEVWDLRSMINNLMLSKRTTGSRDDILRVMELVAPRERYLVKPKRKEEKITLSAHRKNFKR